MMIHATLRTVLLLMVSYAHLMVNVSYRQILLCVPVSQVTKVINVRTVLRDI